MSGVLIEMIAVGRSFGPRRVLNGLNLSVAPGEFVAVVGRSGSGKSTLLRLLAGLDRPDAGEVRVGGVPLTGLNAAARMMFQDGRLLPWLRVRDNVALGRPASDREAVVRLLERVGLADRAGDWPAVLSGGQRQRVALARALAADPRVLLLDEPLGSLDALIRVEMQRLVEAVWAERRFTAVLITHDVEEAVALADRVLLLDGGRIRAEWPVQAARPRTKAAVAGLADAILGRLLAPTA